MLSTFWQLHGAPVNVLERRCWRQEQETCLAALAEPDLLVEVEAVAVLD